MSTLAVNTITDVAGSLPPVFPAGSPQLNPLANREDKIINGDFGVWQRGTSFTTNVYGADRWYNNISGGTVTQSQQAFTLGDTLGVNSPTFFFRQAVSGQTLTTHFANTFQAIEGVRSYAGQTVTVLGWARRSSGAGNMVVEGEQYFGAGGSPSATVAAISPTTVTLTGSWAPFAAVVTFPSITGKTLGVNGNDAACIQFFTSAGSDYSARSNSLGLQTIGVDFWGIHIRQGTWTAAATADYRPRDPGTELELCQRYCETIGTGTNRPNVGVAISRSTTTAGAVYSFSVEKRAVPAFSYKVGSLASYYRLIGYGSGFTGSITAFVDATQQGTYIEWTGTGLTVGGGYVLQGIDGQTPVIIADAEL